MQYLSVHDKGVMYVSGAVVADAHKGRGLGKEMARQGMTKFEHDGKKVDYIAGRTQNQVVAQARCGYCESVSPISVHPDDEIIEIAYTLISHLGMEHHSFHPDLLTVKGAYDVPLYQKRPRSSNAEINSFFDTYVGPQDAVFIIGKPIRN